MLMKRVIPALQGSAAGEAFEHYILMEILAYKGIHDLDFEVTFWRTKTGLEVDFILGDAEVAIEVKISSSPHKSDLKGIIAFQEEHNPKKAIVVSLVPKPRLLQLESGAEILILPWNIFLDRLWAQEILI